MTHTSLDPRMNRLGLNFSKEDISKEMPDQLEPYEVFWLAKLNKPYEHAGIVHASDVEMAFLFGKEQYSRRGGTCYGIKTVASKDILASEYTDGEINAFTRLPDLGSVSYPAKFEVYMLKKRGKQHTYLATVEAATAPELKDSLMALQTTPCFNLWLVPYAVLHQEEEHSIWTTLPDKGYRDAAAYKSGDKIAAFKAALRNEEGRGKNEELVSG